MTDEKILKELKAINRRLELIRMGVSGMTFLNRKILNSRRKNESVIG